MTESQFDVFLAHSSKDKPLIRQIYHELQARGIKPWLDEEEIAPGTSFQDEIQQAIGKIKTAAVFIGQEGLGPWQALELKTFISQCIHRSIPVIPVLLPGVANIPEQLLFLREFNAVTFVTGIEDEKAFYRLEWGITRKRPVVSPDPSPKPKPNPLPPIKYLKECDPSKLLFIKNVRAPRKWAYSFDWMQYPENRVFELMWRSGSHGAKTPAKEDLMILHQQARVTHIVEFLDNEVRSNEHGFHRWVQAVWMPELQNWHQLPHQKDVLSFNPNYTGGSTHSLNSPNFSTFRANWSNLEDFQKYIFEKLS